MSRRLGGCLAVPLVALLLAGLTASSWLAGIGHWLTTPTGPASADVAVVLGGGGPQRLLRAIDLYRAGEVGAVWLTGDWTTDRTTSFIDADFIRDYVTSQGVRAEDLRLLHSTSTWEDGQIIATTAREEGIDRLLVVTNWSHSRRAWCVLRHHLAGGEVRLGYTRPQDETTDPDTWWQSEEGLVEVTNELLKTAFYWQKYGLAPWTC